MRSDCIRLLVADSLRLGQPVKTILPLTDEARDRVIDSTCHAWQQIQNIAVDREVDAVILNGETLRPEDFSAEAEHALREGLSLLLEGGIRVVLHSGDDEHRLFWREFLTEETELRNGVSLISGTIPLPLCPRSDEELEDEEEILCRLVSIQDHVLPDEHDEHGVSHANGAPFTIGLSSVFRTTNALPPGIDLLVSGGSAWWNCSRDGSLQQCLCAAPQALSQEEAESGIEQGCLLIELSGTGEVAVERRPTASVRFLECELDLSSCRDWDDAALQLQNRIEAISWDELESVRLLTWTLKPGDPLSRELLEGPGVDQLVSAWSDSFPLEDGLQIVHGFEPARHSPHQWINSRTNSDMKELAEALFQQELTGENSRLGQLREEWPSDEYSSQLWTRLNPHLRHPQIGRHAEALISHWLKTSDPENLPYETHIP